MAYIQQNSPPPNRVLNFSLTNFVGGLNNRSEILQENQCSDVLNMAFSDDSVMEKRRGTTFFDTLELNAPLVFIDEFKPYTGSDLLVRATATELWFSTTKVADISGQMTGMNFLGKYFFCDGEKIRVYGKFPQASTTYEHIIGTPSDAHMLFQVVNPPSTYVALGVEHLRGRVIYDYTNKQVWYEPCVNELEDPYKGSNLLPEKPRFMVNHTGRAFASGSDRDNDTVFISDVHNPYYFPVSTSIQLPPNSDRVVGLHVFDSALIVGRRNDIYAIHGQTNRAGLGAPVFSLQRVNSHTGWASHYAVDTAHNYLFFLGSDGLAYALASSQASNDNLSSSVLTQNVDFFKSPIGFSRSELSDAKTIFFDDKWYLSLKDKVLVYSYRHQAWTLYTGLEARSWYKFDNVLIWGDKFGRTSMPSEDHLDYGVPFQAYWQSANFDMGDANAFKQFREFFIVAHTFAELNSDIYVTFEVDYADVKSDIVIENQIAVWGRSRFGDRFITRNINASIPFVIGRRGRNFRFKFTNGYKIAPPVADESLLENYVNPRIGTMVFVQSVGKYHVYEFGTWRALEMIDLNQAMRVYQMNGEYEFRGKR